MKFEFYREEYLAISLEKGNSTEYWSFSVNKLLSKFNKQRIQFCFEKESFSFFRNKENVFRYGATDEDFEHLLSYQDGRNIVEQLKIYGTVIENLKNKNDIKFSIIKDEIWENNTNFCIIDLLVEDSPVIFHCAYNMFEGVFSMSFRLSKDFKQKCSLKLDKEDLKFFEDLAFEFVKKHSKQRLRMLTKNANHS